MRLKKLILPMSTGLLLLLALRASAPAAEAPKDSETPGAAERKGNEPAIKDFGIEKSDPIDAGFFLFARGKYIEAPYVVERRGLDVYINNVLVSRGAEWPPFDYTVKDDPGDPPPGIGPFDGAPKGEDPRNSYWFRKGRYLLSHYDGETAVRMMMDAFRKCEKVAEVIPGPHDKKIFTVVDKAGHKVGVNMEVGSESAQERKDLSDKGKVLAWAQKNMKIEVDRVKAGGLLLQVEGCQMILSRRDAVKLIDALLSEETPERRLAALEERAWIPRGGGVFSVIATEFQASPQLKERLEKLRQKPR